ncbi:MAG TPA: cation transporter [Acholeplasmataceae bacterium]|nr:cation transporter [Acholeplasmataceae bacterium]
MRYKQISRVLFSILILNVVVALLKIILGFIYKLNSLSADGFHAITDSSSNVVGLIAIKIASKPPDEKHPYGHQKFETIASMIIGIMLFIITLKIIYQAINWFLNPVNPNVNFISIIPLILSFFINLFISIYEYQKGKKLKSDILISDSIHTRSDLLISLGVIIVTVLIVLGFPPIIDPILSLIIALFIFYSCYEILKKTTSTLVDSKIIDNEVLANLIYQENKDIIDVHKIRSRGNQNLIYIDMHIIVPKNMTVEDVHNLSHHLENVLGNYFKTEVELIIHIEPDNILD